MELFYIVPRIDGFADLSGHAVISTVDGEKRTYNLYSLGHENTNGSTKDNDAAFFSTASRGKLAVLIIW
jgi:hypothetical protein